MVRMRPCSLSTTKPVATEQPATSVSNDIGAHTRSLRTRPAIRALTVSRATAGSRVDSWWGGAALSRDDGWGDALDDAPPAGLRAQRRLTDHLQRLGLLARRRAAVRGHGRRPCGCGCCCGGGSLVPAAPAERSAPPPRPPTAEYPASGEHLRGLAPRRPPARRRPGRSQLPQQKCPCQIVGVGRAALLGLVGRRRLW